MGTNHQKALHQTLQSPSLENSEREPLWCGTAAFCLLLFYKSLPALAAIKVRPRGVAASLSSCALSSTESKKLGGGRKIERFCAGGRMEKALTRVSSLKVGGSWISKKAKEELSNITEDLSTFSNTVEEKAKWIFNKLKGKPMKSLADLLREYNLPPGLFPLNVSCYEFDESKAKLVVYLPSVCEISFKDSSVIRYATRVKAILMRGKLTGIEGMKTKVLVWVKVTCVAVEGYKSDKVWFTAGVKKSRPRVAYEAPQAAVRVEEF